MHTLKSLRALAGMNQKEWASACGVSPSTVYQWENGNGEPGLTVLHRMSDITGVSIDDIFMDVDSAELNGGSK